MAGAKGRSLGQAGPGVLGSIPWGCVTLGKCFSLSGPHFPLPYNPGMDSAAGPLSVLRSPGPARKTQRLHGCAWASPRTPLSSPVSATLFSSPWYVGVWEILH